MWNLFERVASVPGARLNRPKCQRCGLPIIRLRGETSYTPGLCFFCEKRIRPAPKPKEKP
jgi:uncharacterized Zn finger protein (UPF0148 family)